MYNEERKEQFLKERNETAILSVNTQNAFELAGPIEEEYGRDLCEWNSTEILNFYRYYNTPSIQSLIVINNAMVIYTDWCLKNGLVSDGQNHYREIRSDLLSTCINQKALDNSVISREDLVKSIRELPNFTDKFIILGIFEGISLKEMSEVKYSDLDGDVLNLSDGKQIHISNELQTIMKYAADETEYIGMTKNNFVYNYVQSDCIIKPFISRKGVQENPTLMIGTRLRKCSKYLGLPNLTVKQIAESGRIYFIHNMIKENGISLHQALTEKRYNIKHETIYGHIQSRPNYVAVYGKYYHVYNDL